MTAPRKAARDSSGRGRTQSDQFGRPVPRLPSERDESSDSQSGPLPTAEQRHAYEDVRRGVVDTDRGPLLDRLYNERVKGSGTKPPASKRRRRAR